MQPSLWSDSFRPHRLQHTRLPSPSLSPGVCSDSRPFSQWWYLTILSSATLFSFCLQSFPETGSFPESWLFSSGGQSIGASASVLPMNIQDWFPLGLTGNLLAVQGTQESPTPQFESINSSTLSLLYGPPLTSVYDCCKNREFDCGLLLAKWCLCFLIHCLGLS